MIIEYDKLKPNKRILRDGEVLRVPFQFMDADQRAVAVEDARAEFKQRLSDAWRDPASASAALPPTSIEDAYAARDHALTNAWRDAGRE